MPSDRVFAVKQLLDKLLVHHRHRGGGRRVLIADPASHHDPRPITTCVPTESKYSALTLTMDAPTSILGCPCTCTPVPQLLSSIGVYKLMPTFFTPGSS